MTLRGRRYLGQRELLDDPHWSGKLDWLDRNSFKRSGHRPDLVGFASDKAIAIGVELDAILKLHLGWVIAEETNGVIYICGDAEGCRRIERAGRRVGLYPTSKHLRIELIDTIKAETVTAFESSRQTAEPTAA